MSEQPWKQAFQNYATSSFLDVLRRESPHMMPTPSAGGDAVEAPHGTTVLALRFRDGVIMAGDRQATAGYQVASRRIDKVFKCDDLSGIGIAGRSEERRVGKEGRSRWSPYH